MNCRAFREWASLYLDHQLPIARHRICSLHLADCEPCRLYLSQIRALSRGLGQLPRPAPPEELLRGTLATLEDRRQKVENGSLGRTISWVLMHSRAISAGASICITVFCYMLILGQLRPIPYLRAARRSPSVTLSFSQYRWVNGLVETMPAGQSYTFPRLQDINQLDSRFSDLDPGPIIVIALVHSDGRASLVKVLRPQSSPRLVKQVETALDMLTFRPAMTGGHAVPTQLILMMEQVDVRG